MLTFPVQSANGVYWIVLEAGVALIAVNLPVLYSSMAKHETLQTVVKRMRSIISLRSGSSKNSNKEDV
jgi:hypothetical protein